MSRTLIRYTIPLDSTAQKSHRLGVNSLVVDASDSGTLYSAGRDGIIAAWDLNMTLSKAPSKYNDEDSEIQIDSINGESSYKRSIQAHTNWVNQLSISPDNQKIYACSSDTSVKCWRPNSFENDKCETLGSHGDYVKSLVAPTYTDEWISTAGLDRSIILWDTSGKGERSRIDVGSIDGGMKQSIYSLTSGPNLLASGGIEKVIRVWDTRTCRRITKFVGHTDNVRSLMCSDDGKTFLSASSDTTIKIWDLAAGRCLHTLTVHSEPVWTLSSDHPKLAVFHAGDRSGLVTKFDLRSQISKDTTKECIAICKEETGINCLAQLGDQLFAATSSANINRWQDFESPPSDPFADTDAPLTRIESSASSRSVTQDGVTGARVTLKQHRRPSDFLNGTKGGLAGSGSQGGIAKKRNSIWSQASVVSLPLDDDSRKNTSTETLEPLRDRPDSTILGQAGLAAHVLLPDRRRVLTRDTKGFVKLWDITQCKQISAFGQVAIEDVETRLQSVDAVGSWCSVNTRVGALTVEMDPRNLLDAEIYFDSVSTAGSNLDFEARNQRFNIGKWMLKALFQGVVIAETSKDVSNRRSLRARRPGKLDLGILSTPPIQDSSETMTPRASLMSPSFGSKNPYASAMATPGASIGLTTPAPTYNPKVNGLTHQSQGSVSSIGSMRDSLNSPTVQSDYFSSPHGTKDPEATPTTEPTTPGSVSKTPGGGSLMKNMKWLRSNKGNKTITTPEVKKNSPIVANSVTPMSPVVNPAGPVMALATPTNFREFIDQQRARVTPEPGVRADTGSNLMSWMQPLEPMPVLELPNNLDISIALFKPGEGEAKDIYRGTVGSMAQDLGSLTTILPVWLAQILFLNEIPAQMQNIEANKHYFSFLPHNKSALQDPFNTSGASLMRLGAVRSLRIRKALTYISQRLDATVTEREGQGRNEEEWLEIIVNGTSVDPDWTLMMTRRHLWKQGGDMKLEYKLKRET